MTIAALDIGGTKIVGALFDDTGPVERIEVPTPVVDGRADPDGTVTREVGQALAARAPGTLKGVGLSVCEYVDRGSVVSREVLSWPCGDQWLLDVFGEVPVTVESDVRCGARAELSLGALAARNSGYFVSWGTGISGCLVHGGRIVEGAHGRAIALGELVVSGGRLEGLASGAAIGERFARLTGGRTFTAREVVALASAGDRAALEVVTSAGTALADAVAAVARLLDPGIVVFGGGLGSARTPAFDALRERLQGHASAGLAPLRTVHADLGPDGPLVGAALAAGWPGSLRQRRPSAGHRSP